jgi:Peptidase family M23
MGPGKRSTRALVTVVGTTLIAAALTVLPHAGPATAGEWTADEYGPKDFIFPLAGEDKGTNSCAYGRFYYSDTFGAARSGGRTHQGVDIMTCGYKGVPVVAAADGVIRYVNWSWTEEGIDPDRCCTLAIDHGDGYETWYIHLNNDSQREDGSYTDDGQGWGIAPGIVPGVEVRAGQLVAWSGDSGNAESTLPHLHWEVHYDGQVLNPTPYADWATRIPAPMPETYAGYFWDDEGSVHEANIDIMFEEGITRGCNPPYNDNYCPGDNITRGQMAAFLRRLLELPSVGTDYFTDDGESIFEDDINALAEAGIAFGCTATEYCVGDPLRREEMAELLVRTFGYDNPDGVDFFVDDESSPFQDSINKLRNHGITKGCNPPDNDRFCATDPLTRAQMATFLARALELGT